MNESIATTTTTTTTATTTSSAIITTTMNLYKPWLYTSLSFYGEPNSALHSNGTALFKSITLHQWKSNESLKVNDDFHILEHNL